MRISITLFCILICLCCAHTAHAKYKHKHRARGTASYYAAKYDGRKTSTGEVFSNEGYTAASNKFRLGAYARVKDLENGHTVYVLINDRMGNQERLIDLTTAAADRLGFRTQGLAHVRVKVVHDRKGRRHIRRQERNA